MTGARKPIFKKVDHVSLTVKNIDEAVDFYTRIMGAELRYRMGPFDAREIPAMEDGRDWTEAHVNVPDACLHIAMLQLCPNLRMELFEYTRPTDARQAPARNCDVGCRHVCIEVDDVENAIDYLRESGCTPLEGPIVAEGGPAPDSWSWYVLDPFGMQYELVEFK